MKILIVEDDPGVGLLLSKVLEQEGYAVDLADSGEKGRSLAWVHDYDGIVLDLELPDRHGMSILQELRRQGDTTPILILTGLTDEEVVVRALDAGADDYIRKPVTNAEFRARIRALVRRGGAQRTEQLVVGDLLMNRLTHEVYHDTRPLDLTPTEFQILEHFMLRPDEVVARTELLEKVWDVNFDPSSNVVDVHLARLRKKLEQAGVKSRLRTIRGVGVKLVPSGHAS